MNQYNLTMEQITAYRTWLSGEEKSAGTIEKYLRDIGAFARWLKGAPVSKDRTSEWKTHLLAQGYAPVTINSMLAALNGLFHFLGWDECRSKFLRIQRRLFREERRELTCGEYDSLLETARSLGRERLALVMETLCATGIRCAISPWRRPGPDGRKFPSRGRYAPSYCPKSCAGSCGSTPVKIKLPLARSFSPEAGAGCPRNKYGRK